MTQGELVVKALDPQFEGRCRGMFEAASRSGL
jgi:hypothetical protein